MPFDISIGGKYSSSKKKATSVDAVNCMAEVFHMHSFFVFIEWCFNTWYLPLMLCDEQWRYRVLFPIMSYSLFFCLHTSYTLILRFSSNSTLNWVWTWFTCHRPKWATLSELCMKGVYRVPCITDTESLFVILETNVLFISYWVIWVVALCPTSIALVFVSM